MLPISGHKLIDLIPQKPPFVLISTLLDVNEKTCTTDFSFDHTHVLFHNGHMTAAGLMENIAQTAAAKMGFEYFLQNKPIPIGFIGDVRDFQFTQLPVMGDILVTEITIDTKVFDITIISGRVRLGDQTIASCKMKIFVEPEKKEVAQSAQI